MPVDKGQRGVQGDGAVAVFGAEQSGEDRLCKVDLYRAGIAREVVAAAREGAVLPHHLIHIQAQARTVFTEEGKGRKRDGKGHPEEAFRKRAGAPAGDFVLERVLEICEDDNENSEVRQLEVIFYENNLFGKYSCTFILFLHLTQILHVAKVEKNLHVPKKVCSFATNNTNHCGGLLIKDACE